VTVSDIDISLIGANMVLMSRVACTRNSPPTD